MNIYMYDTSCSLRQLFSISSDMEINLSIDKYFN